MNKIFFSEILNCPAADRFFSFLNLLIPTAIGTYIFFKPLPFSVINEICYYFCIITVAVLIIIKKTSFSIRTPLTVPLFLFFLWAVFGLFFTMDLKNSIHDLRGHFLEYIAIFYLLINYFNSQKKMEIISWIVIASATTFSIGAIIYYYFIEGFSSSARLGFTFKEMHTDYIGFVTIFAATLSLNNFYRNKIIPYKILFLFCFLVICATTLLTQSRGALIGLAVSLIILCFAYKKNIIVVLIIILLALATPGLKERFNYQALIHNERNNINLLTLELIKEHPVTGIGFGMQIYGNKVPDDLKTLNDKLPENDQIRMIIPSPHNTFLDIAVRTGIIGLVLFLYSLYAALILIWKVLKSGKNDNFQSWAICLLACFMAFFIPAIFADTTFGPPAVVFYTILGMITILWKINRQEIKSIMKENNCK